MENIIAAVLSIIISLIMVYIVDKKFGYKE